MAKDTPTSAQKHANSRTDYSYRDPNRGTAATHASQTHPALRQDNTEYEQTVKAKVVGVCGAMRVAGGFHQQVTVEFTHVAGCVYRDSRRKTGYKMRETLPVYQASAPLKCGQTLKLTYTYKVDSRMQPHSIEWQTATVV